MKKLFIFCLAAMLIGFAGYDASAQRGKKHGKGKKERQVKQRRGKQNQRFENRRVVQGQRADNRRNAGKTPRRIMVQRSTPQ